MNTSMMIIIHLLFTFSMMRFSQSIVSFTIISNDIIDISEIELYHEENRIPSEKIIIKFNTEYNVLIPFSFNLQFNSYHNDTYSSQKCLDGNYSTNCFAEKLFVHEKFGYITPSIQVLHK